MPEISMNVQTIRDVHRLLDAMPSFCAEGGAAADFTLDRFRAYCAAAGDPQDQFKSVHVAGSNGKGSTCQLIASIYLEAGYRVGVYTSPHILCYNERFSIEGTNISDEELVEFFQNQGDLISHYKLSYFEITTAIAFWWFARRAVDVGVIETGLGGRLDATNVVRPMISVITTVTLDHTDILGDTIEAIAGEKAGIIKPSTPVITGNIPPEAAAAIRQKAKEQNAPWHDSTALEPQGANGTYYLSMNNKDMTLSSSLQTPVQAYNIAAAWTCSRVLQQYLPITEQERRMGVKNVGTHFPNQARFERLSPQLPWYFDGAHNIQAVQAMKQMVETMQPVDDSVLIFSMMRDKITEKIILEFSEFKKIIYYAQPLQRAATADEIRERMARVTSFPNDRESRIKLFKELKSELVIFAGSFYFYATVRDWLSLINNGR